MALQTSLRSLAPFCFLCEILLLLAVFPHPALAQQPELSTNDDGTVEVTLRVSTGEEQVRAAMADPEASCRLTPDILSVEVIQKGPCQELHIETRGLNRPLSYSSLRCPTPHGWQEVLIESDDFESMTSEWLFFSEGNGTRIVYRIATSVNLPVPDFLIRQNLKNAAKTTVIALKHRLGLE